MIDFSEVLERVPDWKKYYTLDELRESSAQLARNYPGVVELLKLGALPNRVGDMCHP